MTNPPTLQPSHSSARGTLLSRSFRKAKVLFDAWLANMTAYRAELIIWMLAGAVPLIMMAVWIGKAQAGGGSVGGLDARAFAAYFLAAWLAQQSTVAWVAWELDFAIRQGNLSTKLLRPIDPFWEYIMQHVTERFVRIPLVIGLVLIGLLIAPKGTVLTPGLAAVLVFALSIGLAFLVRFLISYIIGILAFWTEQATAFDEGYYVLATFLAGGFAPLELFPTALRSFVDWTPFPYIVYYPAKILTGQLPASDIARVFAVQLGWVLGLVVLRQVMWRVGLKKYGAVGA